MRWWRKDCIKSLLNLYKGENDIPKYDWNHFKKFGWRCIKIQIKQL